LITHYGTVIEGDWQMGKIKELPAYKLANGTVFTGDWKDDF